MSYLRHLDEARRHLGRRDLLAAEDALDAAERAWSSSRLRAHLIDRGLDPLLRRVGALFGRDRQRSVLPVFEEKATQVRAEVEELVRLLHLELQAQLSAREADADDACEFFEEALRLHRHSRRFRLAPEQVWPVLRLYLEGCRRTARVPDAGLLPAATPEAGERAWFSQWCENWLRAPTDPVDALARWALEGTRKLAATGPLEERGHWYALACRMALVGPRDGTTALELGRRALAEPLDPTWAAPLLRRVAGLAVNEHEMATSGADPDRALEAFRPTAEALGLEWPPEDLRALLRRRRPQRPQDAILCAAFSEDGRRIAVVLHDGQTPCDLLCVEIVGEERPRGAQQATLAELRGWFGRFAPAESVLLVPGRLPAPLASALGGRPRLEVDSLLDLFAAVEDERAPAAPRHPHPGIGARGAGSWTPLVEQARGLLPRLRARLVRPALAESWGRANLRALAGAGVDGCAVVLRLVEVFGEEIGAKVPLGEDAFEPVDLSVGLRWPRLSERPWPETVPAPSSTSAAAPAILDDGDAWWDGVPEAERLAVWAMGVGDVDLVCADEARARRIAAVAAAVDPRRVGRGRGRALCRRHALEGLEDALGRALGGDGPEEVLWLLVALSETADGDLDRIAACAPAEWAQRWRLKWERADRCDGDCVARRRGMPCWQEQLEERRRRTALWIEGALDTMPDDGHRRLWIDDLRTWLGGPTPQVRRRLDALRRGLAVRSRVFVLMPSGGLRARLRPWLDALLPDGRGFTRVGPDQAREGPGWRVALAGYSPDARRLGREGRRLLELRADALRRALPALQWIDPERAEGFGAEADEVAVVSLGGEADDDGLRVLRAAAVASCARARVFVLDPRLPAVLPGPSFHTSDPEEPPEIARALGPGRDLLAAAADRRWRRPLDAARLGEAAGEGQPDEVRVELLAAALATVDARRGAILAGATEAERSRLVTVVEDLAREALDGGPLGVRCLVEWSERGLPPGEALEAALLEVQRGRRWHLRVHPSVLTDVAWMEWATRTPDLAWLVRHAETFEAPERRAALVELRRSTAARRCPWYVCVDDPDPASARPAGLWAARFELPVASVGGLRSALAGWTWTRLPVGAEVEVSSAGGERVRATHLGSPGAEGTVPALGDELARIEAVLDRETRLADLLRRAGPQAQWTLLCGDRAEAERLAAACGLPDSASADTGGAEQFSLAQARHFTGSTVVLDALWEEEALLGDFACARPPASADELRALVLRLRARGRAVGQLEVFDAPLGLWQVRPALPARWGRGALRRAEVEARLESTCAVLAERTEAMPAPVGPARWLWRAELHRWSPADRASLVGDWFEASDGASLRSFAEAEDRRSLLALVLWLWEEGRGRTAPDARESAEAGPTGGVDLHWERRFRAVSSRSAEPLLTAVEDAPRGVEGREAHARPSVPPEAAPGASAFAGIAGAGRTTWIRSRLAASSQEAVLVLTGAASGRLAFSGEIRPGHDVATCTEFALALVGPSTRRRRMRLLPPAGRAEGEEIRIELMRETSRRYAAAAGRVPPLESHELRRVVEGRAARAVLVAAAGEEGVDPGLLERCARDARWELGVLHEDDLRGLPAALGSRGRVSFEAWSARYASVTIDDVHLCPTALRELVTEVFGSDRITTTFDPVLEGDAEVSDDAFRSRRLSGELLEANEAVWRSAAPLSARLRSKERRRRKTRCLRERAINVDAALARLEAAIDPGADLRVAIALASDTDRARVHQRLAGEGWPVVRASQVAEWASPGPRELLAAVALLHDREAPERWLPLLETVAPERTPGALAAKASRLPALAAGEAPADRLEAWLSRLFLVAVHGGETLGETGRAVLRSRLLEAWDASPLIRSRIEGFLEAEGHRRAWGWQVEIDAATLAAPRSSSRQIWVAHPDELAGLEFDEVFHVCTGHEPASRHYAVLSRGRRRATILYSERDPLADAL